VEGQRELLERDLQVVLVELEQLVKRVLGAAAERALEIGELDERDLGCLATLARRLVDLDLVDFVGNGRRGGGAATPSPLALRSRKRHRSWLTEVPLSTSFLAAGDLFIHRGLELLVGHGARMGRPLMKKLGVPCTPNSRASARSLSTAALKVWLSSAALNLPMLRPIFAAYFSRAGRSRAD